MNPFELIKNAKLLQSQVGKIQEELAELRVEGSSGGGIVRVVLNGQFDMLEVFIDPIAVDSRDVQMLQDLIVAAHVNASEKIKEELKSKMGPYAGSFSAL